MQKYLRDIGVAETVKLCNIVVSVNLLHTQEVGQPFANSKSLIPNPFDS